VQRNLERLNLHPDLVRLIQPHNGLVIVSGATGSGSGAVTQVPTQWASGISPANGLELANVTNTRLHQIV